MKKNHEIVIQKEYVLLKLTGKAMIRDEILNTMSDVIRTCYENNTHKCIIYRKNNAQQVASITDYYSCGNFLVEKKLHGFRAAMVYLAKIQNEVLPFFETVCINRGINTKLFTSFAEAEKWICEE